MKAYLLTRNERIQRQERIVAALWEFARSVKHDPPDITCVDTFVASSVTDETRKLSLNRAGFIKAFETIFREFDNAIEQVQ